MFERFSSRFSSYVVTVRWQDSSRVGTNEHLKFGWSLAVDDGRRFGGSMRLRLQSIAESRKRSDLLFGWILSLAYGLCLGRSLFLSLRKILSL